MNEFFGERKGQITGALYTSTSLAYTIVPLITGLIVKDGNVTEIFWFAVFINLVGIISAAVVNYRYIKVFFQKKVTIGEVA